MFTVATKIYIRLYRWCVLCPNNYKDDIWWSKVWMWAKRCRLGFTWSTSLCLEKRSRSLWLRLAVWWKCPPSCLHSQITMRWRFAWSSYNVQVPQPDRFSWPHHETGSLLLHRYKTLYFTLFTALFMYSMFQFCQPNHIRCLSHFHWATSLRD